MRDRKLKLVQTTGIVLGLILVTAIFLNSPGTEDMNIWTRWFNNIRTYGVVAGYEANDADYPPLSSVILLCAVRVAQVWGIEVFDAIKLSILFFLSLTSFVFWLWTRDVVITALLHLSLLLNSVALGYIDIYFAPPLLLSMWALEKRRLALFALAFSIAILTKWQPLIIVPFVALYVLNGAEVAHWKQIDFKKLAIEVLLPATATAIVTLAIFGFTPVLKAFEASLSHKYLSGNALNLNWVITHFLHVFYPDQFGSLLDGQATWIITTSLKVTLIPRLLFLLFYVITVVSFFKREKSYENLVLFSLLGYLAYFMLNIGVHENHLFLATVLSILLCWVNKKHVLLMITVVLMSNINLFVFYGIDGLGLAFSRVIGHRIDMALVIAAVNFGVFSFYWAANVLTDTNFTAAHQ